MAEAVLEVEGLSIEFPTSRGLIYAVNEVTLSLKSGEILAVVGESGCGKSTLAFSLLHLIPEPGRIAGGDHSSQRSEFRRDGPSRSAGISRRASQYGVPSGDGFVQSGHLVLPNLFAYS